MVDELKNEEEKKAEIVFRKKLIVGNSRRATEYTTVLFKELVDPDLNLEDAQDFFSVHTDTTTQGIFDKYAHIMRTAFQTPDYSIFPEAVQDEVESLAFDIFEAWEDIMSPEDFEQLCADGEGVFACSITNEKDIGVARAKALLASRHVKGWQIKFEQTFCLALEDALTASGIAIPKSYKLLVPESVRSEHAITVQMYQAKADKTAQSEEVSREEALPFDPEVGDFMNRLAQKEYQEGTDNMNHLADLLGSATTIRPAEFAAFVKEFPDPRNCLRVVLRLDSPVFKMFE